MALSLAYGNSVLETFSIVNEGIGGTFGEIFITILFGAMIAMGIMDTGAVTSIANFFIRLLKGKNLEWATSLTAFIMSIPVFGDITVVLVRSYSGSVSKTVKYKYVSHGIYGHGGMFDDAWRSSANTWYISRYLNAGCRSWSNDSYWLDSLLLALAVIFFLFRNWADKTYIPPKEEFTVGIEPAPEDATVEAMYIKDESQISAFAAFLPLLLPVIFLSSGAVAKIIFPEGSAALNFFNIISDRVIAMGSGVVCAALLGLKNPKSVIRNALKKKWAAVGNCF